MNERYLALKKVLDNLYNELLFPIGGSNDVAKAIWMEEPNRRLVTIAQDDGFVTVANTGQVIRNKESYEVEALYLTAFKSEKIFNFKDVMEGIKEESAS